MRTTRTAKGKLCARGYGYSPDRLLGGPPYRPAEEERPGQSSRPSAWDQAYSEIAEKVKRHHRRRRPRGARDGAGSASQRQVLHEALHERAGQSANVYTHGAACNLSKESGFTQAIGTGSYASDVANSKMTMFIGRSYADAIRPSSRGRAAEGPRERRRTSCWWTRAATTASVFADEWVPINPGTDLALVLAMSQRARARMAATTRSSWPRTPSASTSGPRTSTDYTPAVGRGRSRASRPTPSRAWRSSSPRRPPRPPSSPAGAARSAARTRTRARRRAPSACSTRCWAAGTRKGGALFTPSVSAGELDDEKLRRPCRSPRASSVGAAEYPLALVEHGHEPLRRPGTRRTARVKGMFFYNSNMAAGYSNPAIPGRSCLGNLDLMVVIDVQMSETCHARRLRAARHELPGAPGAARVHRRQGPGRGAARPGDREGASRTRSRSTRSSPSWPRHAAWASTSRFTVEELADAQLQTRGPFARRAQARRARRTSPRRRSPTARRRSGRRPPSKVQFTSEACEKAGLPAAPGVDGARGACPWATSCGSSAASRPSTATRRPRTSKTLMQITKDYDLDPRVDQRRRGADAWASPTATRWRCRTSEHTGRVRAKVTQRINPDGAVHAQPLRLLVA